MRSRQRIFILSPSKFSISVYMAASRAICRYGYLRCDLIASTGVDVLYDRACGFGVRTPTTTSPPEIKRWRTARAPRTRSSGCLSAWHNETRPPGCAASSQYDAAGAGHHPCPNRPTCRARNHAVYPAVVDMPAVPVPGAIAAAAPAAPCRRRCCWPAAVEEFVVLAGRLWCVRVLKLSSLVCVYPVCKCATWRAPKARRQFCLDWTNS